jgi:hypothetical protein
MTQTFTTTSTFTRTSARHISSKVVTDLRRINFYYGRPTEEEIEAYYGELVELLAEGYLESVEYGFRRDGQRVVSVYYEVRADGSLSDNRAGGLYARADTSAASWFSFMNKSATFFALPPPERERIEERLPVRRTPGHAPVDGSGYWITDRSYAADGVGTQRRIFRPY